MQRFQQVFVGGAWRAISGGAELEVLDPTHEAPIGSVPRSGRAEVDAAVAAARAAFGPWSRTPPRERAEHLARLASALTARRDELARTITRELGMPYELSKRVQAGLPAAVLAGLA
jgi:aldehyde dehydrogenase (NAD+)